MTSFHRFLGTAKPAMFENIMVWRLKGEDALRGNRVPHTIVRPDDVRNSPADQSLLKAIQGNPKVNGAVSRGDPAALGFQAARGKTFEVIDVERAPPSDWTASMAELRTDGR